VGDGKFAVGLLQRYFDQKTQLVAICLEASPRRQLQNCAQNCRSCLLGRSKLSFCHQAHVASCLSEIFSLFEDKDNIRFETINELVHVFKITERNDTSAHFNIWNPFWSFAYF
jgi:hypothetical protein